MSCAASEEVTLELTFETQVSRITCCVKSWGGAVFAVAEFLFPPLNLLLPQPSPYQNGATIHSVAQTKNLG